MFSNRRLYTDSFSGVCFSSLHAARNVREAIPSIWVLHLLASLAARHTSEVSLESEMGQLLHEKSFATLSLLALPDQWEAVAPVTNDVEDYPAACEAWTTVLHTQERKRQSLVLPVPLFHRTFAITTYPIISAFNPKDNALGRLKY